MAGKRTVSAAMLAHLRQIASRGGKSTAQKYGGWSAPHKARKGTHKASTSVTTVAQEARRAATKPVVKVPTLKPKSLVSTTASRAKLPKSGFTSRPPAGRVSTRATSTKLRTTTSRSKR